MLSWRKPTPTLVGDDPEVKSEPVTNAAKSGKRAKSGKKKARRPGKPYRMNLPKALLWLLILLIGLLTAFFWYRLALWIFAKPDHDSVGWFTVLCLPAVYVGRLLGRITLAIQALKSFLNRVPSLISVVKRSPETTGDRRFNTT
ncbi:hypothetical protein [Larkinella soli]|uniref:hypothetical protein n=1 Tax=Larkinella soli TaxID=1770527 RepID=UPI000FFB7E90|nr:hypothetical protein [Larkinella soli]